MHSRMRATHARLMFARREFTPLRRSHLLSLSSPSPLPSLSTLIEPTPRGCKMHALRVGTTPRMRAGAGAGSPEASGSKRRAYDAAVQSLVSTALAAPNADRSARRDTYIDSRAAGPPSPLSASAKLPHGLARARRPACPHSCIDPYARTDLQAHAPARRR